MLSQQSLFATAEASRQLKRLCKHFSHKTEAEWDEHQGQVRFAIGVCRMQAGAQGLALHCTADNPDDLAQLQEIVRIHLQRFAGLESLLLDWHTA